MEQLYKRLGNLLSIKSLVTLVLTAVKALTDVLFCTTAHKERLIPAH